MPDPLPPPPPPGGPLPRAVVEDKLLLVLCYLGLLAVIPYLVARGPGLLRFHARQGLALGLLGVICAGVALVPFIGFVGHLGIALVFVLSILGIVKALSGESWRVPVAADLADRFQL
jgi:uncharacterized membrane protein